MIKVKLKSSFINSNKKDGTPYINRKGEPFKMCNITSEKGNKASMYIGSKDNWKLEIVEKWRPGDEVNVNLTKSGDFTNFDLIREQTLNHTTQTKQTQPEAILEQIRPIGEDPRQEIPTMEDMDMMWHNNLKEPQKEIDLMEITF